MTTGNIQHLFTDPQLYSIFFFFVFLVLHVAAHLVNALNFSENYNEEFVTLNAANYRGEVRQLSFHIFVLSISFKYMNICISQCHCVIYTVFLFHALKTHHCVDSCGFSFFLLTKHIWKPARFSPVWLLDGECNHLNFHLASCSPGFFLLLSVPWVGLVNTFLLLFGQICSAFPLFRIQWDLKLILHFSAYIWRHIWVYMLSMELLIYMNWFYLRNIWFVCLVWLWRRSLAGISDS